MPENVSILGLAIHNLTEDEALATLEDFIRSGTAHQVVTVNPEFLVMARGDDTFRAALAGADLALADGAGILWAARRQGQPLRGRVTGTDLTIQLAERAASEGYRIFFLGAEPGVAEAAAAVLAHRYPSLQVAGVYAGSPSAKEADEIVERVRQAHPDVLLVAYGAPAQDVWLARYRERLGVPVMMGVGGAFDYISGRVSRAPAWMRRHGLEWLYRLVRQPWRWRRMLRLPVFVWLVWRKARLSGAEVNFQVPE